MPVAVITGGSRGIGLEVARGLGRRGLEIVIVGKQPELGRAAAAVVAASGSGARASWLGADLSSMGEVRQVAARIAASHPRIDILIHNAAVVTRSRVMTAEGLETQFAVNHLAPYLLTHELWPQLQGADEPRVVVTASQMERGGTIDFADLMGARDYHPSRAYSQSKLANVLFTYELADRVRETRTSVNCLHPGVVRTDLLDTLGAVKRADAAPRSLVGRTVAAIRRPVGRALRALRLKAAAKDWALTPEQGAATTLAVALAPEFRGVSGRYFSAGAVAESSSQSHDAALRRRLWMVSAELVGVDPGWGLQ